MDKELAITLFFLGCAIVGYAWIIAYQLYRKDEDGR